MKTAIDTKLKITSSPFLKLLFDPSRFKKKEDGWVRDSFLGIEWGPSSGIRMSFKAAKKYCVDLGGRLPLINELQSLVDYSRRSPAINTDFFGDTKTDDWYWTGTEVAGYSSSAWCVGFSSGHVVSSHKGNDYYVRPVRASQ